VPEGFSSYALAALALGGSWLLIPFGRKPRSLLVAALAGPRLALVLLVQAGLFSDRNPALRAALAEPEIANALSEGPVAVINKRPMAVGIEGLEGSTHGHDVIPVDLVVAAIIAVAAVRLDQANHFFIIVRRIIERRFGFVVLNGKIRPIRY
jgi:hypothetical protein